MKRILTNTGISLLCATVLSFAPALVSHAQDDAEITPTTTETPFSNYGIVRGSDGSSLRVQLLNGTTENFPLGETVESPAVANGELVGFNTDESGVITELEPPAISNSFEGTITEIEGDQVTLSSASGEVLTTTIMPSTISRLALEPGKDLVVTEFEGTWATKVCCVEPPVEEIPEPAGGIEPELPPPAPAPIPALW